MNGLWLNFSQVKVCINFLKWYKKSPKGIPEAMAEGKHILADQEVGLDN